MLCHLTDLEHYGTICPRLGCSFLYTEGVMGVLGGLVHWEE